MTSVKYKLTPEEYLQYNLYHFHNNPRLKQKYQKRRLVECIFYLGIGGLVFYAGLFVLAICFFILAILWYPLYPKLQEWRMKRAVQKRLRFEDPNKFFRINTVTLQKEYIEKNTRGGNAKTIDYSSLRHIEVQDGMLFLTSNLAVEMAIPLRVFSNAEERDSFLSVIRNRAGLVV